MGGWNTAGNYGWQMRRERPAGLPRTHSRWTAPDIAVTVVAFVIHWEVGLAFLALKLWQQSSGYQGSVLSFAREKWDGLVSAASTLMSGRSLPTSFNFGTRSSGNHAFDAWRRTELGRIEAERSKLRAAERDFASYRDGLLHAKDSEDFSRFMQSRDGDKAAGPLV